MHWVVFSVVVYLFTVAQTALAPFLDVNAVRPQLMVILAVYLALSARVQDALLACWIIGFVMDLTSHSYVSHGNVGLHALLMGTLAMMIVKTRDWTHRDNVVSHLVFTFAGSLFMSLGVGVHALWISDAWGRFDGFLAMSIYTAMYTTILAPYGHWCLAKIRGSLGVGPAHRLHTR